MPTKKGLGITRAARFVSPKKNKTDAKFVSSQKHEMVTISKQFTGDNGENIPVQLVYFIYFMMQANYKKVERAVFYHVLGFMGYSRNDENVKPRK